MRMARQISAANTSAFLVSFTAGVPAALSVFTRGQMKSHVAAQLPSVLGPLVVKAHLESNRRAIYVLLETESLTTEQRDTVAGALQVLGAVTPIPAEDHQARIDAGLKFRQAKEAQADQLIGAAQASTLTTDLMGMMGRGGTGKTKRKFAMMGMEVVTTGQRAAASARRDKLRSAVEDDEADDDDDE